MCSELDITVDNAQRFNGYFPRKPQLAGLSLITRRLEQLYVTGALPNADHTTHLLDIVFLPADSKGKQGWRSFYVGLSTPVSSFMKHWVDAAFPYTCLT